MKDKIQIQLDEVDILIQRAKDCYDDCINSLNDKKCILSMALNAPIEIDSVDGLPSVDVSPVINAFSQTKE